MDTALRQRLVVQPGGVIEIRSPELLPGTWAEVIVILEKPPVTAQGLGWPLAFSRNSPAACRICLTARRKATSQRGMN